MLLILAVHFLGYSVACYRMLASYRNTSLIPRLSPWLNEKKKFCQGKGWGYRNTCMQPLFCYVNGTEPSGFNIILSHIGTIQQPSHQVSWWLLWFWSQDVFLTVRIMEEHLGEHIRCEGNLEWHYGTSLLKSIRVTEGSEGACNCCFIVIRVLLMYKFFYQAELTLLKLAIALNVNILASVNVKVRIYDIQNYKAVHHCDIMQVSTFLVWSFLIIVRFWWHSTLSIRAHFFHHLWWFAL